MNKLMIFILALTMASVWSATIKDYGRVHSDRPKNIDLFFGFFDSMENQKGGVNKIQGHIDEDSKDQKEISIVDEIDALLKHQSDLAQLKSEVNQTHDSSQTQLTRNQSTLTKNNSNQQNSRKLKSQNSNRLLFSFKPFPSMVIGNRSTNNSRATVNGGSTLIQDISQDQPSLKGYKYLQRYLSANFPNCTWNRSETRRLFTGAYYISFIMDFNLTNGTKKQANYSVHLKLDQTYELKRKPTQQLYNQLRASCNPSLSKIQIQVDNVDNVDKTQNITLANPRIVGLPNPVNHEPFLSKIIRKWNQFKQKLQIFFGLKDQQVHYSTGLYKIPQISKSLNISEDTYQFPINNQSNETNITKPIQTTNQTTNDSLTFNSSNSTGRLLFAKIQISNSTVVPVIRNSSIDMPIVIAGGVSIITDIYKDQLGSRSFKYLSSYLTANFPICSWKLTKASGQIVAGYIHYFNIQFDVGNGTKLQYEYGVWTKVQPIFELTGKPSQEQYFNLSTRCSPSPSKTQIQVDNRDVYIKVEENKHKEDAKENAKEEEVHEIQTYKGWTFKQNVMAILGQFVYRLQSIFQFFRR